MESLIRQTRVRFSGVGQENKEETGDRDRKVPPQKTQTIKGEKKSTRNWFLRQQMSQDHDSSNEGDYPVAVAAAAFAVNSLEELSNKDQKRMREGLYTTFTKTKSKTEDTRNQVSEAGKTSRRFSGEPSMINIEVADNKISEEAVGPVSSIKRTPTFADKHSNSTSSRQPEHVLPKLKQTSTKRPAFPPTGFTRQSSTRTGIGETEADTWERAKMAKIKERYEKLNTTILDWEQKKKAKAKSRLNRRESELERRRAKALQDYRSEVERINSIAEGARAQAEESQRNEFFKVKEKANKIRSTGKTPATCWCF